MGLTIQPLAPYNSTTTMTALVLLLAATPLSPEAVLARYAAYRKAVPALSVDIDFQLTGKNSVKGYLLVDRNKRFFFHASAKGETYEASQTENGTVEYCPEQKIYDELEPFPATLAISSRISELSNVLPGLLLRSSIPANPKLSLEGQESVQGDPSDIVGWKVQTQLGPIHYTVSIDHSGKVRRFVRGGSAKSIEQPFGEPSQTWTFSNYQPISHVMLAMFSRSVPLGYIPYALPPVAEMNAEVTGVVPAITLSDGSDLSKQLGSKGSFVMITAPQCEPSKRLLGARSLIQAAVGETGAKFTSVSLAGSKSLAQGQTFDASGQLHKWLGKAPTPLMIYVGQDGKVGMIWSGYDPKQNRSLIAEIKKVINTYKPG